MCSLQSREGSLRVAREELIMLVHKHLIIRAEVEQPPVLPAFVVEWLRQTVEAIGMKYCQVRTLNT
jgi:hypothetical protein